MVVVQFYVLQNFVLVDPAPGKEQKKEEERKCTMLQCFKFSKATMLMMT